MDDSDLLSPSLCDSQNEATGSAVTGIDFSSYRNELQWEPEKVGSGTIGTILIKLCMYW